ncbi:MAG: WHG domain-containing protein [Myxococcales bacterium]|nr:WHG domain-containing protein [Myxococcales bacterium]
MKPIAREDAARVICERLARRPKLGRDELSARSLARALGQTTGFLYHHWGSLDAFLLEVSGLGWMMLADALVEAFARDGDARAVPAAYVTFAARRPALYWLIAERPMADRAVAALMRESGALPSHAAWVRVGELLANATPSMTPARFRAMHAAVHGLASQLLSGRLATLPDSRGRDALEVALEIADEIGAAFFGPVSARSTAARSPGRGRRAAFPPRR